MAFSTDETLLNSISLDSIRDYKMYIEQMRPIMLAESGFKEIDDPAYNEGLLRAQDKVRLTQEKISYFRDQLSQTQDKNQIAILQKTINDLSDPANGQIALDKKELESFQANTPKMRLEKTPERVALEERFKKLEAEQLSLSEKQLKRQQDALEGKIETSPILQKAITDQFNQFKESQARAGNVIMGDDPFNAVAKGSAAQESLRAFQDNAKAEKQREIQAIVQGETPLTYGGLELASGLSGRRAYAMPGAPDYAGATSLSLSGQQPFQFDRQMQYNYDAMNRASKTTSGKSGLLGSMAGAGIGLGIAAAFPGALPMTTAMGAMGMGSQFGGGFGSLFGG